MSNNRATAAKALLDDPLAVELLTTHMLNFRTGNTKQRLTLALTRLATEPERMAPNGPQKT